jgi:hypothetical protein
MLTQPTRTIEVCAPLGWCKTKLDLGIRSHILWHPDRASPHILVAGQSGAGKTKFLELFASCCARDIPDCELYLADPKRIDFGFAKGSKRAFFGEDSAGAIESFHASMMARVNDTDLSTHWKILIFDELAAFTLMLQTDKKRLSAFQNLMASVALLGRGVRHVLCCGVQKALMETVTARSQYGTVVLMGNTDNDKEQINMLMSQHKNTIAVTPNTRGQFWVTQDGKGIRRGQTPWITDIESVHALILEGLNREI